MPSSTPTTEIKIILPTDFSGEPSESMNQGHEGLFAINDRLYTSNEVQVMTTLNKMGKGRGVAFSEKWYDKMANNDVDVTEKTFEKFSANFKTIFCPFDIKATACSE
ncbi:hypothetical protein OG21DRAFT_1491236 [Imleria badia]|nr:hypothetical protein OG21DRAFT_1491236 [Imleria badia]